MATLRSYKTSFNAGEVAPALYSRIDNDRYQSGLALCRNFLVEPQGPIQFRPGFVYVNKVKDSSSAPNLIPFSFSTDQTMVLEFGDHYVRFHTQGKTLLGDDGAAYEVESVYSADEVFDIHFVQSADVMTLVHPNHPPMELRRYGATDWRFVEINFSSPLPTPAAPTVKQHINDSTSNPEDYIRKYAITALNADGTQESAVSPGTSIDCNPYGDGAYNEISWEAVEGAERYRIYRDVGGLWAFIGETTSLSIEDDNITADSSITPPIYEDPFELTKGIRSVNVLNGGSGYKNGSVAALSMDMLAEGKIKHTTSTSKEVFYDYSAEGKSGDSADLKSAEENGWPCVCGRAKHPSISAEIIDLDGSGSGAEVSIETFQDSVSIEIEGGNQTYFFTGMKSISLISSGQNYKTPAIRLKFDDVYVGMGVFSFEATYLADLKTDTKIKVSDSTGSGAELVPVLKNGAILSVQVRSAGKDYTNPTITVESPEGSGERLTANIGTGDYPGAVSYFEQRRWFGGTPNKPNNLWATKSGTESNMSYSLPTQDDDRIAVRVAAREANRIRHIVPLSQLMLLTGAAEWRVSPLNSDAITPASMSVRPQSYVGANNVQPLVVNNQMLYASERGGHIRECGYSYEAGGYVTNDVCLMAPHLFDNLKITGMTYSKAPWPIAWAVSSSGKLIAFTYVPEQRVGAFSTVETSGVFEACCSVAEGDEDALYVVVKREINGQTVRFIERMHERQFKTLEDCVFMDCAGTYDGVETTEVSGLDWLEGMEVCILADGSVEPNQVVSGGKITIETPAKKIHVGLPYVGDIRTLPLAVALQDGSYGTSHRKNVREVFFRVVDSSGLKSGPTFENMAIYPPRSTEFAGSPPDTITDEFGFVIPAAWGAGGQVCIRQDMPLPLRIISMTTVFEMV